MKLSKRIKHIVTLTVDDFYSSGKSTSESKESLISWLCDDMLKIENIENLYTYEINMLILEKLKSLDIIDISFIVDLLCKNMKSGNNEDIDLKFDEVL